MLFTNTEAADGGSSIVGLELTIFFEKKELVEGRLYVDALCIQDRSKPRVDTKS